MENRVQSDVPIGEYDAEQIAEFIERDTLTPEAEAIVRDVERQLATTSRER